MISEITESLNSKDYKKALRYISFFRFKEEDTNNLKEEYINLDRTLRKTQVGKIQKDKILKDKIVTNVKITIPLQNKIVSTSVAFELGKKINVTPQSQTEFTDFFKEVWDKNRIQHLIHKMVTNKKSVLESALLIYIKKKGTENVVKSKVLENDEGTMIPVLDGDGDMIYFAWVFNNKDVDGKEVEHTWIYDEENVTKLKRIGGTVEEDTIEPHGLDKIPIVYVNQKSPEWRLAETMIDRLEVSQSKLGDANDYSGHPILKITGKVEGGPDKDESGKSIRCEIVIDPETQKEVRSDVDFLTYDNAPESVKLEIENLIDYAHLVTSTPKLSFDKLVGLGHISALALNLMFLDPIIKANSNEGANRTMIDRIINVLTSACRAVKKLSGENPKFDVLFESILPNDRKENVEIAVQGFSGNLISQEESIKMMGIANDVDDEIKKINSNTINNNNNNNNQNQN